LLWSVFDSKVIALVEKKRSLALKIQSHKNLGKINMIYLEINKFLYKNSKIKKM